MKNERGSSLLIVMLIVFVTATIGTAVSSFILYNYRLRTLDNAIGRAEYEAEKIMDQVYVATQNTVEEIINDKLSGAYNEIAGEYYDEIVYKTTSDYGQVQDGKYTSDRSWIEGKLAKEFNSLLYQEGVLKGVLEGKISSITNALSIEISEEVDATEGNEKIIEGIKVKYQTEGTPLIELSANFVISYPEYSAAVARDYNLNNVVGITNWQMQNWGYL